MSSTLVSSTRSSLYPVCSLESRPFLYNRQEQLLQQCQWVDGMGSSQWSSRSFRSPEVCSGGHPNSSPFHTDFKTLASLSLIFSGCIAPRQLEYCPPMTSKWQFSQIAPSPPPEEVCLALPGRAESLVSCPKAGRGPLTDLTWLLAFSPAPCPGTISKSLMESIFDAENGTMTMQF